MVARNYAEAMKFELVWEGGKVNHPKDPGGKTNQGITQRVYTSWRRNNALPDNDVYNMAPNERDAIYRELYWKPIRGDDLASGVDLIVFDGAVNSGPVQSVKWLQRAINDLTPGGAVSVDGLMGPATLSAARKVRPDLLVTKITERRMAFLKQLKTWGTFGTGWTRRVSAAHKTAQALVGNQPIVVQTTVLDPKGAARADIKDAKPVPTVIAADLATGGGLAGGGLIAALNEAKDQLLPLAGASSWINTVIGIITVVTTLAVVGGIAYRFYARARTKERADALDLPGGAQAA